eukprot:12247746-Karenia_brevis.AAC.1
MGDLNAVDIAQQTHVSALHREGNMAPDVTLVYGDPLPSGDLLEGVVVDDHLIMHIVSQRNMRSASAKDKDA